MRQAKKVRCFSRAALFLFLPVVCWWQGNRSRREEVPFGSFDRSLGDCYIETRVSCPLVQPQKVIFADVFVVLTNWSMKQGPHGYCQ